MLLSSYKHNPFTLFLESLASCHALMYVNNELLGDPLEAIMFEQTGWVMNESDAAI